MLTKKWWPYVVGIFRSNSLFIGANCRGAVSDGRADFTPIFLSEVPLLFRRKILNLDVALIQVSLPDIHGFCTLGPSVDTTRAAIQNAKFIIGKQRLCGLAYMLWTGITIYWGYNQYKYWMWCGHFSLTGSAYSLYICMLDWLIDWAWFIVSTNTIYTLSGRQFYTHRSKDPTNSIKVLKEKTL